ncbi:MAG: hypothetical protein ACK4N5_08785 [Myxococcales bacterium]
MDVKPFLQELLAVGHQPHPVVSVYLDTRWGDEDQRDRVRVFLHEQARLAAKRGGESLYRAIQAIETYTAGLIRARYDEWATGTAIFCCEPLNFFRVLRTRLEFDPMRFVVDSRPHILPLVQALQEMPELLICAVDSHGAHLFEVSLGIVDVDAQVTRPFPGRHGMGGWSQLRYQKHIHRILERNLKDSAVALTGFADEIPRAMIVLAGTTPVASEFEKLLPDRIQKRVIGKIPYPSWSSEGELRETLFRSAMPLAQRWQRSRAVAARERALEEAARDGLGVIGREQVVEALNEGRVHRLLIDENYDETGSVCLSCDAVIGGEDGACRYCNGQLSTIPFSEALARRAVRDDAEVVFIPPGAELPNGDRIAAQLRHRRGFQGLHGEFAPSSRDQGWVEQHATESKGFIA